MKTHNTPAKAPPEDWHPADIICALRKAGWSLRRLSAHHGYHPGSLQVAAYAGKWPAGERLIADALGVEPQEIWPSRYASRAAKVAAREALRGVQLKGSRRQDPRQEKPSDKAEPTTSGDDHA
jgi:Ner family transcriptional regulator